MPGRSPNHGEIEQNACHRRAYFRERSRRTTCPETARKLRRSKPPVRLNAILSLQFNCCGTHRIRLKLRVMPPANIRATRVNTIGRRFSVQKTVQGGPEATLSFGSRRASGAVYAAEERDILIKAQPPSKSTVGAIYDRAYVTDSTATRGHRPRLQLLHQFFNTPPKTDGNKAHFKTFKSTSDGNSKLHPDVVYFLFMDLRRNPNSPKPVNAIPKSSNVPGSGTVGAPWINVLSIAEASLPTIGSNVSATMRSEGDPV